jgi:hypothetical protein
LPTVCLASTDIASQFKDLRKSFNLLGYDVKTYVHKIPDSKIIARDNYDYIGNNSFPISFKKLLVSKGFLGRIFNFIARKIRPYFISSLIDTLIDDCDFFIFLSSNFTENLVDLKKIKEKNRKILFIFCGDDARWYFSMKQEFLANGLQPVSYEKDYSYNTRALNFRLQAIRKAEKYADFIFSKREQAQLQIRPFYHFPMTVFFSDFTAKVTNQRLIPKVLHAPSSPNIKGSKFVIDAFNRLQNEGISFTPILLENIPNEDILKIIEDSDIVIDQLLIPGGGKLSTEALACGKVVLSNMSYGNYYQGVNIDNCPIVDVCPNTIYDVLKKTILDLQFRTSLSMKGKIYVEQNLDTTILVKKIVDLFEKKDIDPDYAPSYFMKQFVPESSKARRLYNRWTNFIKNEDWFKSAKTLSKREGLLFD